MLVVLFFLLGLLVLDLGREIRKSFDRARAESISLGDNYSAHERE